MIEKRVATSTIGLITGQVTVLNRCHLFAPSSAAASASSVGHRLQTRPESRSRKKGVPRQMFAMQSEIRAFHGSPRKLISLSISPRSSSSQLIGLSTELKSIRNARLLSAVGTM